MLMAAVLWIVIIGAIAATVRIFVMPAFEERRHEDLTKKTSSEGRYRHNVRIAADGFSGYCIFRSQNMSSRLARDGIQLSVIDDDADYMSRIRALEDGSVDMALFPINSFIQCGAQLGNFPGAIVYIVDETTGADAILAHSSSVPDISSLNSPQARIVLTPDSPSEFLARVMLANFNLPEFPTRDWIIEANGSHEVFNRFRGDSHNVPMAYAMWEPDVSRALRDDDAHILLDSSKVRGFIVDALVVRREFLVDSFDLTRQVVEAYARTLYENQHEMEKMVLSDARALGIELTQEDAANTANKIDWKNTLENYAHFDLTTESHSLENIEDIIMKIADVLVRTGALSRNPVEGRANKLYFNRILRAMRDDNFHPGREINIVTGMDTGDQAERVRETRDLPNLTGAQWSSLRRVGELSVDPIRFGRGTARITVQGNHQITALASTLRSWPQYYLTITGRVRPGGNEALALELARSRADAIRDALSQEGIPMARMRATAEIGDVNGAQDQTVSFVFGQMPY